MPNHPKPFPHFVDRRAFMRLTAAGAAAASVGGLGIGAVNAADPFIIHGEGGSWGETQQKVFVRPFAEEHKDREFIYSSEAASGVVLSKILLACGKPDFSVANINTNLGPIVEAAGCVDTLNPELVPNLEHVADVAKLKNAAGDTYFASSILMIMGLVWNTKLATRPTSWEDLWKEEYKGRIGVPDFGYLGQTWLPAIARLHGGSEADITAGLDAIEELVKKNQAILVQNTDQAMKLFESEQIVMAPFWNGRTFAMQKRGIPVAIEVVDKSVLNGDGYVTMKGSADPEVSQSFINYNLQGENALRLAEITGYPPSDMRTKLPEEYAPVAVTPADLEHLLKLDFKTIGENRETNLRLWNERIKG